MYFRAKDEINGEELWQVDSSGNTSLVRDIRSGSDGSYPNDFTPVGDKLYFRAYDGTDGYELWQLNSSGTVSLVEDISSNLSNFLLYGSNGNDILRGNAGADIFVLETTSGSDTIADFRNNIDSLGLSGSLTFDKLGISNNSDETAVVIVDATRNNRVLAVVNNISAGDLTIDDFVEI